MEIIVGHTASLVPLDCETQIFDFSCKYICSSCQFTSPGLLIMRMFKKKHWSTPRKCILTLFFRQNVRNNSQVSASLRRYMFLFPSTSVMNLSRLWTVAHVTTLTCRRKRVFPDQSFSWIVLQGKADRGANEKNQWEVMCLLPTTSQVSGEPPEWVFREFFFVSRPFSCTISAGGKTPICSRPLSILSQLRAIKTAECQRAARRGSEETEESN